MRRGHERVDRRVQVELAAAARQPVARARVVRVRVVRRVRHEAEAERRERQAEPVVRLIPGAPEQNHGDDDEAHEEHLQVRRHSFHERAVPAPQAGRRRTAVEDDAAHVELHASPLPFKQSADCSNHHEPCTNDERVYL